MQFSSSLFRSPGREGKSVKVGGVCSVCVCGAGKRDL